MNFDIPSVGLSTSGLDNIGNQTTDQSVASTQQDAQKSLQDAMGKDLANFKTDYSWQTSYSSSTSSGQDGTDASQEPTVQASGTFNANYNVNGEEKSISKSFNYPEGEETGDVEGMQSAINGFQDEVSSDYSSFMDQFKSEISAMVEKISSMVSNLFSNASE